MGFKDLEELLVSLGVPGGTFVLGIIVAILIIHYWKDIKLFCSDVLRRWPLSLFRFARKTSVKFDVEGRIHAFISEFNSEMYEDLLPSCKLEWVTGDTDTSYFQDGKAIIRISFEKRNRALNLYNAAYTYVRTGLLPKTKPFLSKTMGMALDLLLTRHLLLQKERGLLIEFNNRFRRVDDSAKQLFYNLEETEHRGLFKRVLLQELHYFGEQIGERAPSSAIEQEADRFVDWVYEIAIRERGEHSDLNFESTYFRVALILVASEDTYNAYGIDPYVLRAQKYAANGFPIVYILARGVLHTNIALEAADKLVKTECFSYLTKRNTLKRTIGGMEILVTCIPLRIESLTIVQRAWQRLTKAQSEKSQVMAVVTDLACDKITVDVGGLEVVLPSAMLSTETLPDPRKYFSRGDDLTLEVVECEPDRQHIILSNKGTNTDPARMIEEASAFLEIDVAATIKKFHTIDDYDFGMFVTFSRLGFDGYVPRKLATYSRFIRLSEKFSIGQEVLATPVSFDREHGNFRTKLFGLTDPWANMDKCRIGDVLNCIVREKREYSATLEVEEGVEAILPVNEISWDSNISPTALINTLQIGQSMQAKVISIDHDYRLIRVSMKRLSTSPEEQFFRQHQNSIVQVKVNEVHDGHLDLLLYADNAPLHAYLPIKEWSWTRCPGLKGMIVTGDQIDVLIMDYNHRSNTVVTSRKRCNPNYFSEAHQHLKEGDEVQARVTGVMGDCYTARIQLPDGHEVEAYIHKMELSNVLYVSAERWPTFLDNDQTYRCIVKRLIDPAEIVELSRKRFLQKNIRQLAYGETYNVKIVDYYRGKLSVYCDDLEGCFIRSWRNPCLGQTRSIIIAKKDNETLEINVADADEKRKR